MLRYIIEKLKIMMKKIDIDCDKNIKIIFGSERASLAAILWPSYCFRENHWQIKQKQ